jgi:hypothetical protein
MWCHNFVVKKRGPKKRGDTHRTQVPLTDEERETLYERAKALSQSCGRSVSMADLLRWGALAQSGYYGRKAMLTESTITDPHLSQENKKFWGGDVPGRIERSLPWDTTTGDVILLVRATRHFDNAGVPMNYIQTNLPWTCVQGSPSGWAWGYGGSGPSDLAMNILNAHYPPDDDTINGSVDCFVGKCSAIAWRLRQDFKHDFLIDFPSAGGTIPGAQIRAWVEHHLPRILPDLESDLAFRLEQKKWAEEDAAAAAEGDD